MHVFRLTASANFTVKQCNVVSYTVKHAATGVCGGYTNDLLLQD